MGLNFLAALPMYQRPPRQQRLHEEGAGRETAVGTKEEEEERKSESRQSDHVRPPLPLSVEERPCFKENLKRATPQK